ncbi:MAG: 2-oxoacid:ferredoxin oxidoreductase subunit beta [Anaerolineales bacterium]
MSTNGRVIAKGLNRIGLTKKDYGGRPSTLCAGCGHDSISSQIITVCYELGIKPEGLIKLSGIGCSSKSPAYFISRSHGFNAVHGRMPSVGTGALLANRSLKAIGVSGDGDTSSIGIGQFKHVMRRNVPLVYVVENNGVYGLTKGQFSPTADVGSIQKHYGQNELPPVDLALEAISAGCGYVARSFAGDPKQVRPLLKGALAFEGTSMLDVISPCVTFNNHDASTKSFAWMRAHDEPLHLVDYVPAQAEISVDYEPGETREVQLHDGSHIVLKKLDEDYDPTNRDAAIAILEKSRREGVFLTGLIYFNPQVEILAEQIGLTETPLALLPDDQLRPPPESLDRIMAAML